MSDFTVGVLERDLGISDADLERRGYTKTLVHGNFGDTLFIHESHPRYAAIMST